jgi:P4 family phage/plasmid primase-like protien
MNIAKMDFNSFLESHKTNGKDYTHTRVGFPSGSYNIPDGIENQKFTNYYINEIKNDDELNFSERQKEVGPLMTDYDFEFKPLNEYKIRQYKFNHIKIICEIINVIIKKYFDVEKQNINAYITEKDHPSIKYNSDCSMKIIKDGFHICYFLPFTIKQRTFIYNKLKNYAKTKDILKDIPFCNNYDSIIDESTIYRNNWMMYKSVKKINGISSQVYELTHVLDYNCNEIDDTYEDEELIILFSIRQYNDDDELNYSDKYLQKYGDFDDNFNENLEKNVKDESNIVNRPISPYNMNKNIDETKFMSKKDKNKYIANELLKIIDIKRRDNYHDWVSIGWALRSVSKKLYDVFVNYSKTSPKYKLGCCKSVWDKARTYGKFLTMKTLKHYAYVDNRQLYKDLMQKFESEEFKLALTGDDEDIANYIYSCYEHKFVCSSITFQTWYVFKNHKWHISEGATDLRNKIANSIANEYYAKANSEYINQRNKINEQFKDVEYINDAYDSEQEKEIEKEKKETLRNKLKEEKKINDGRKKYMNVIKKLKNNSTLSNIIKSCAHKFFIADFEKNLDENKFLIGFENGVYDLREKVFRNGIPEDYISLSTGYDYQEFKGDEPEFNDIAKYFENLQMNEKVREFLLRLISSCLEGCSSEHFTIFSGGGANGKSVFTSLLKKIFGEYYSTFENTVITRKKGNPSNATPELADKRGKRIITIAEPDSDDSIKVNTVKQYSGGTDEVSARALYKAEFKFVPQFKMFLICNMLPVLNNIDGGILRRIFVVEFSTTFVHHKPIRSNQVQINKKIGELIQSGLWSPYIMWLLIHRYYEEYEEYNLQPPEEVLYSTKAYIKSSDIYIDFIDLHYEITQEKISSEKIYLRDVYTEFRDWYKPLNPSSSCPNKTKLKDYFNHNTEVKVLHDEELINIIRKKKDYVEDDFNI